MDQALLVTEVQVTIKWASLIQQIEMGAEQKTVNPVVKVNGLSKMNLVFILRSPPFQEVK